jgi:hypothetical protein
MPASVVDRAATLRSAKGLVSLAWKAGFTMRSGMAVQSVLARLAPDTILMPGPGGGFPWQWKRCAGSWSSLSGWAVSTSRGNSRDLHCES